MQTHRPFLAATLAAVLGLGSRAALAQVGPGEPPPEAPPAATGAGAPAAASDRATVTWRAPPADTSESRGSIGAGEDAPDEDEPDPVANPTHRRKSCLGCVKGIVFEGSIGGGASAVVEENGWSGLLTLGATGLYHDEWLELGCAFTLETELFGFSSFRPSFLAGVKRDAVSWLRFELLGEGGADLVWGVGRGLFSRVVSGGSAAAPYVGARAGLSFLLGLSHRFLLGLWINAGDTIGPTSVSSVIQDCFLDCSQAQSTFTIGGPSWTTGVRIGGEVAQW